jgi:23S rRNA (cytosine1962-C5)-methyltransferase/23S rRNA (guanine2445-N2)-methyltransferase / 23S rRNA (guanine2069-N7)-methyltransferase
MMLNPGGILYFSNNKRKFKLSPELQSKYVIKDKSAESIPQDFHDKKIHNCFEIQAKPS